MASERRGPPEADAGPDITGGTVVWAEVWRVARFLSVGGLNTAFGYASYAALVLTGLPLWVCVAGATTLAFLFNFVSYGSLVFGSTATRLLPRFLLFYSGLGLMNFALLRALGSAGLGPIVAQGLLVPVLAAAGYLGMKRFVFRWTR